MKFLFHVYLLRLAVIFGRIMGHVAQQLWPENEQMPEGTNGHEFFCRLREFRYRDRSLKGRKTDLLY